MSDPTTADTDEPTRLVAQISLCVRHDAYGKPIWTADNRFEASTAQEALSQVGADMDVALARIPDFWSE